MHTPKTVVTFANDILLDKSTKWTLEHDVGVHPVLLYMMGYILFPIIPCFPVLGSTIDFQFDNMSRDNRAMELSHGLSFETSQDLAHTRQFLPTWNTQDIGNKREDMLEFADFPRNLCRLETTVHPQRVKWSLVVKLERTTSGSSSCSTHASQKTNHACY